MATTAIWAVKNHLRQRVEYVQQPEKTDGGRYVSGVNCDPQIATEEMNITKEAWHKTGGIHAFHAYQSFEKYEVTPEQAHEIGMEFARRMWGDRFQVVVATHVDTGIIHNHFVVNSVSFVDGSRYYDNKKSYYGGVRKISDELCREHGLKVIDTPQSRGKHYAQTKAEQAGAPTIRSTIRADIDEAVRHAYTFADFVEGLKKKGYTVQYGQNTKHMKVRPEGAKGYFRLYKLGDEYSEQALRERITRQREQGRRLEKQGLAPLKKYRLASPLQRQRHRPHGFTALYLRYLYMLRKVKYRQAAPVNFTVREDLRKLQQVQKQFLFLHRHRLHTAAEVAEHWRATGEKIADLEGQRHQLRAQKRRAQGPEAEQIATLIAVQTAQLRELRSDAGLCKKIMETTPRVEENLRAQDAADRQKAQRRERGQTEKFRLR